MSEAEDTSTQHHRPSTAPGATSSGPSSCFAKGKLNLPEEAVDEACRRRAPPTMMKARRRRRGATRS